MQGSYISRSEPLLGGILLRFCDDGSCYVIMNHPPRQHHRGQYLMDFVAENKNYTSLRIVVNFDALTFAGFKIHVNFGI